MGKLKEKAKARSEKKTTKKTGKLANKAKSRSPTSSAPTGQTIDEIEREEGVGGAAAPLTTPNVVAQRPPLPPALAWLRQKSTIPALRQREP